MKTSPNKLPDKRENREHLPEGLASLAKTTLNDKELALIEERGAEEYFDILETGVMSEAIEAAQTASQELDEEGHRANREALMRKLKHKIG